MANLPFRNGNRGTGDADETHQDKMSRVLLGLLMLQAISAAASGPGRLPILTTMMVSPLAARFDPKAECAFCCLIHRFLHGQQHIQDQRRALVRICTD